MVLHGDSDPTVPVTGSRDMVAALQAAGSNVTYLEYEGDDHYIQRRLFEQTDIWMPWLFAQKKGAENTAPDLGDIFKTSKNIPLTLTAVLYRLPGALQEPIRLREASL